MTPEQEAALSAYMHSGKYMPPELRDFHDLKDLFKVIGDRDVKVHDSMPPEIINWRQGMIYTVDHFLHFMAIHGYELRKVKGKVPRKDLADTMTEGRKEQLQVMRTIFERENPLAGVARESLLSALRVIYVAQRNSDMTEGRGRMIDIGAFENRADAEKAAQGQVDGDVVEVMVFSSLADWKQGEQEKLRLIVPRGVLKNT